jgi:hypothetical protein
MREIKYKAYIHTYKFWDSIGCIVDVDTIDFVNKEISFWVNAWYMETDTEFASFDDIELLEYVWQCDSKWIELYEWYIVSVYWNIWVIEYSDTWYAIKYSDWNSIWLYSWHTIDIIWNRFENPDLIK